jgi:glutamate racemase
MLASVIQRVLGPEVTLVDSAEATALTVEATLAELGLAEPEGSATPEDHFCVTDAGERFARIAGRFLGSDELSLEWVEV